MIVRYILSFRAFEQNTVQWIVAFAYQNNLHLSLHTFLYVLRDNRQFLTWHGRLTIPARFLPFRAAVRLYMAPR